MPTFHAIKVFLTYQHCEKIENFSKDSLFTFLQSLSNAKDVTVGQENYPTEEGFHCHCLVTFNKKTRLPFTSFIYHGITPFNQNFRGNSRGEVQRVRTYCKKEGNFMETDWEDCDSSTSKWGEILAAPTRESAVALLVEHYPRDAVLQRRNFDYWADARFRAVEVPYVSPPTYQFDIPPELSDWYNEQLECNTVIF